MRSPWFGRDLLIFLIFLCPLFTSSPTLDEECTVSRTRERTTTFDGAIQLLTEELTGTRVVIQIDRIINDPSGLLQFAKGRIVASLPSSKCISQVRTGVSATWVGGHQWMNNKLIYVVRRLQQGESSKFSIVYFFTYNFWYNLLRSWHWHASRCSVLYNVGSVARAWHGQTRCLGRDGLLSSWF